MSSDVEPCPLFEHDDDGIASLEPERLQARLGSAVAGVACFWPEIIDDFVGDGEQLARLPSLQPLWEIDWKGIPLAVFYPGQGGPLAAVVMERVLAAGSGVVVACGGAGALTEDVGRGQVVVIDAALRDEGTSYHYVAPSRWCRTQRGIVETLCRTADDAGVAHIVGHAWTTDGFFRSTRSLVDRRAREGCIVVEQEAASLLAVARFRNAWFGEYVYAGDDPGQRGWRGERELRRRLFTLAADAAVKLSTRTDP